MNKIEYEKQGDYLIPNIAMKEEILPTGKYAIMRKKYLMEHNKAEYMIMRAEKTLGKHLTEIQEMATKMVNQIVEKMAKQEGTTEEMKQTDQMKWVALMNNYKMVAEEQVVRDLICN